MIMDRFRVLSWSHPKANPETHWHESGNDPRWPPGTAIVAIYIIPDPQAIVKGYFSLDLGLDI